jgi:hypothetical protein
MPKKVSLYVVISLKKYYIFLLCTVYAEFRVLCFHLHAYLWKYWLMYVAFHIEESVLKDVRWIYDNFGLWWSSITISINGTCVVPCSFYCIENCLLYVDISLIKVHNLNFDHFPVFWPFNKLQIMRGVWKVMRLAMLLICSILH